MTPETASVTPDVLLAPLDPAYLADENPARTGLRWSAFLAADALPRAAALLLEAGWHLEDICGLDVREGLAAVYHFDRMAAPGRLAIRVMVDRDAPMLPSIADIHQGAEWHERETADFYGIAFTGNPNPAPLLLPEGMEGYPLLKDAAARAPLAALLAVPGREDTVLRKAEGFTLLEPAEDAKPAKAAKAKPAAGEEGSDNA
ncbi:respiratory-chain NADH dehydrogenase, 30 Kd subunit [Desulfovibrio sp. A2]|nr:respiratory-chain NADH dehydrogenase, 30 Kd subunit [Desulfovibrio sp. A2]